MATPTTHYAHGPVLTIARCQDCDWCHFTHGRCGPQKTRAAVRYHASVKHHRVQVEVRRYTSYEALA